MSHRIVYGQLAIRFTAEELKAASGDWRFYDDRYLLLELGGDNNMTTDHPVTGREVGSRRWILSAFGNHTDVIRDVCTQASYCEGGGMRLYGERNTAPAGFIRRVRNVLKSPVSVSDALQMGFSASVTLTSNPDSDRGRVWTKEADLLSQVVTRVEEGGMHRWTLHPLRSIEHAVQVFLHGNIDESDAWNIAAVDGPRFDFESVVKSYRMCQSSLNLAA